MKKKNNKKLARNAIRARRAVKKRENEQNTSKQRKRIATRIASLLGCLLLVSVLVVPCFADSNNLPDPIPGLPGISDGNNGIPDGMVTSVPDEEEIKTLFYYQYGLDQNSALYSLIESIYYGGQKYFYQFTGNTVGSYVRYDEPLTFNDIQTANTSVCVRDVRNGYLYYFDLGHWATQYTTNGTNRVFLLKFYHLQGISGFEDVLTVRIVYDYETLLISDSTVYSNVIPVNGSTGDYSIASTSVIGENIVLDYFDAMAYGSFDVAQNFTDYESAFLYGYFDGWTYGYDAGYSEGEDEWNERGQQEGYTNGFSLGFALGYDEGFDAGYSYGLSSDANEAYQRGRQSAFNEIESGDFGRNFLGGIFTAPIEALNDFTLISWETANGSTISINLMTILSAIVGLSLFIWFLKMFAGG